MPRAICLMMWVWRDERTPGFLLSASICWALFFSLLALVKVCSRGRIVRECTCTHTQKHTDTDTHLTILCMDSQYKSALEKVSKCCQICRPFFMLLVKHDKPGKKTYWVERHTTNLWQDFSQPLRMLNIALSWPICHMAQWEMMVKYDVCNQVEFICIAHYHSFNVSLTGLNDFQSVNATFRGGSGSGCRASSDKKKVPGSVSKDGSNAEE